MKKYNNFINEDKYREWLLMQPFIIEDEITKELKTVAVGYKNFPECITNKFKWTFIPLTYETLVRLILFSWLARYNGNNELLNNIKSEVSKKQTDIFRPFSQIPTNFIVLSKYFKKFIGDDATIKTTNTLILCKLLTHKNKLFTEINILTWYETINSLTKRSNKGEEKTIQFIKDNKLFINPQAGSDFEDKQGIDIIAYNGDKRITIQVKEPAKNTDIVMYRSKQEIDGKYPYIILIKNTNLEFHKYLKNTDGELPWKFLFLWDYKNNSLYCINSYSITSIIKSANNNVYINMNLDDEWLPKMIKTYEIS